jgi:hypothetical protein
MKNEKNENKCCEFLLNAPNINTVRSKTIRIAIAKFAWLETMTTDVDDDKLIVSNGLLLGVAAKKVRVNHMLRTFS